MNRRSFLNISLGVCAAGVALGCSKNFANKKATLVVEESLCVGCGNCLKVCEGDAIVFIDNKANIDPAKCIHCGNCVKVCPYDAIF